jgi:hypothetical protein
MVTDRRWADGMPERCRYVGTSARLPLLAVPLIRNMPSQRAPPSPQRGWHTAYLRIRRIRYVDTSGRQPPRRQGGVGWYRY